MHAHSNTGTHKHAHAHTGTHRPAPTYTYITSKIFFKLRDLSNFQLIKIGYYVDCIRFFGRSIWRQDNALNVVYIVRQGHYRTMPLYLWCGMALRNADCADHRPISVRGARHRTWSLRNVTNSTYNALLGSCKIHRNKIATAFLCMYLYSA